MDTFSPAPWHRGPVKETLTIWSGDTPIVSVYAYITGREVAEANTILVIAAPDLLQAAKNAIAAVPLHRIEASPEAKLFFHELEILRQVCRAAEKN